MEGGAPQSFPLPPPSPPLPRWEHMAAKGEMQAGQAPHLWPVRGAGPRPPAPPGCGSRGARVRGTRLLSRGRSSGILGGSRSSWRAGPLPPSPRVLAALASSPASFWLAHLPGTCTPFRQAGPPQTHPSTSLALPPSGLGPAAQLPWASPNTRTLRALPISRVLPDSGQRHSECLPAPGLGWVPGVGSGAASPAAGADSADWAAYTGVQSHSSQAGSPGSGVSGSPASGGCSVLSTLGLPPDLYEGNPGPSLSQGPPSSHRTPSEPVTCARARSEPVTCARARLSRLRVQGLRLSRLRVQGPHTPVKSPSEVLGPTPLACK